MPLRLADMARLNISPGTCVVVLTTTKEGSMDYR
jgi:hypothetical protein